MRRLPKAKEDFKFNNGLELTNMPRLKTGSISTYIVPTSVQKPGTSYTLTYKGKTAGTFTGNSTKLDMTEARQVAQDTFELEALKENGVVDYGYVISAYSGGRGANAFVLDEDNSADGKVYQIISSGQGREVTITPAGGQPIVAKYVPFTQSTDGKQEPKFRLPEGADAGCYLYRYLGLGTDCEPDFRCGEFRTAGYHRSRGDQ